MRIVELLISLLSPDHCLGCGVSETWLCDDCIPVSTYPEMCHVCRKPSKGGITCRLCMKKTSISACIVGYELKGLQKDLVWKSKYVPSLSASRRMGKLLEASLPYFDQSTTVLQHVPTAPRRIRERGFDQSLEIARVISGHGKIKSVQTLRRLTNAHQVGSTRKQRKDHMKGAFTCVKPMLIRGKTVILVDDVYTTGSTLESAAKELRSAGAERVVGAVFARAD